jgi:hypothetical protein
MNLQHVNVKLFAEGKPDIHLERFIEVFHQWIATQSTDELLIDVADYRHVPEGPAVILVGHEADYVIDHADGRMGLLYNRKATCEGSSEDKLRQAISAALQACQRLEEEFQDLKFGRSEIAVTINDRALAPNDPETYQTFQPVLDEFIATALGQSDFKVKRHDADGRRLFGVSISLSRPVELDLL